MANTRHDKEIDRARYQRNKKARQAAARKYYRLNKKRIRAYQDKFWWSQEGWATICKAVVRYQMRMKGKSKAEINAKLATMPDRMTHRNGTPLKPWKYTKLSKYNPRSKR